MSSRRWRLTACWSQALLACSAAICACAEIAGIETYHYVDPGPGDSGTDASPDATAPLPCSSDAPFGDPRVLSDIAEGAYATLTPNESTIYFVKSSDPSVAPDDLFSTRRPSAGTEPGPRNDLNTSFWEGRPWISSDDQTIYFASDRPLVDGGAREARIYMAQRSDRFAIFRPPTILTDLPMETKNVFDPFFHEGTQELWFAAQSNLHPSDVGSGARIYRRKIINGVFGPAEPVTEVNSSSSYDSSPVLSPDGLVIFFASNRGSGDTDIFMARRASVSEPFSTPDRVKALNSQSGEDFPNWISPNNCRLYMTSRRSGRFRIYVAERQQ